MYCRISARCSMLYECVKTVNAGIAFVVRLSNEVDVNGRSEKYSYRRNFNRKTKQFKK